MKSIRTASLGKKDRKRLFFTALFLSPLPPPSPTPLGARGEKREGEGGTLGKKRGRKVSSPFYYYVDSPFLSRGVSVSQAARLRAREGGEGGEPEERGPLPPNPSSFATRLYTLHCNC